MAHCAHSSMPKIIRHYDMFVCPTDAIIFTSVKSLKTEKNCENVWIWYAPGFLLHFFSWRFQRADAFVAFLQLGTDELGGS